MRFCPNCGKKITTNTKFCPYCGAKQPVPSSQRPQQPVYQQSRYSSYPKRPNNHKWYVIAAIIIVLIAGFIGYKHSTLSVNLNSEIPNDTWTVKDGNPEDTTYQTRFHADSTTASDHKHGETHTSHMIYLKPTGRHTLKYVYNDNDEEQSIKIPYKVKSGNADHFTIVPYGKIPEDIDGHHMIVHKVSHHFVATYDGHSQKVPQNDINKAKLTLTKEK